MNLIKSIQNILRRQIDSLSLYNYLRRALLLLQYTLSTPHEPDFLAFKVLKHKSNGLFVDIGANGGQSAIAFGSICPYFEIISFEPNPSLWSELDFIKRIIGDRFSYRRSGLGEEKGQFKLYIPTLGQLPITTRASISREAAEQQLHNLTLEKGENGKIAEVKVDIQRFDDLDIHPNVVKIDVEGHELSVLKGMVDTIKNDKPLFLLERNHETGDCQTLLRSHGYHFFDFDLKTKSLSADAEHCSNNWFAIPEELMEEMAIN